MFPKIHPPPPDTRLMCPCRHTCGSRLWEIVTGGICCGEWGLTMIHTKLGWVLSGPIPSLEPVVWSTACVVTMHLLRADMQSTFRVRATVWTTPFILWIGVLGYSPGSLYNEFISHVSFEHGWYKVSLPWKELHDPLQVNCHLSVKWLYSLLHHL